ncbi:Putative osmoprotectant uptake system permease protein YehY [Corynebacterium faecale]|uniref:ABC transporter permease n=1 Tax=Corynebacterium faecale TaxID=1758466 RepID=UPI0025B2D5E4|nr:ABC transporter permease subunit [Corynebacterium faecale]WJY91020.1 Putative osmoprotectant uptake system permease protein YehY [Corynebacterium faecale]
MKWLSQNYPWVIDLTWIHLWLTLPAVLLSLIIAIPLGWTAHRWRIGGALLPVVGVLYAIPSLPLFVLIPVVFGTGLRSPMTMIAVLTIYGVAILTRTVADGFASVPTHVTRAATAIGFSTARRFWSVEFPLALPVIIAGLRVVVVSTVSLVTVGSVVGIQSLGTLFTDGFQRGIVSEVVTGVVLTIALALLLDACCVLAQRILLPWSKAAESHSAAKQGAH